MISVIVPVYNVEKYLGECICSILKQTFTDFELILIDDGSLDSSGKICDQYAKSDKRIRVIHKKNGGLSDARNAGTIISHGHYITYIDSDDYVSKYYLETLYRLTQKYKTQISVTGIKRFLDGERPSIRSHKYIERKYTGREALKKVLYQSKMDTSACSLLIEADIAKRYLFPVGKYHEDDFTTYKYYAAADSVSVTTIPQYFYRQRKQSIMYSYGKSSEDEILATDNLLAECETNWPELVSAAFSKMFSNYYQVLLSDPYLMENNPDIYNKIVRFLTEYRFKMLKDSSARMKNRIAAFTLLFGVQPIIALKKFMIFRRK